MNEAHIRSDLPTGHREGWCVVVVVSNGIYRDPARTVRRVHRAISARRLAGVVRTTSEGWRPHFPTI